MSLGQLLPMVEADEERKQGLRSAQRQQTIVDYMTTANNIRRQLGHVDNLQKALALTLDPNTHQPAAGHEQEAARLRKQLGEIDPNALHTNLTQVEGYIQKLYDPNFNPETGMQGRSPIRALGEKLHLVKPQQAFAQTLSTLPGQFEGQVTPGNIDLNKRQVVRNPDGSISTEQSTSFGTDQGEVLVPTVWDGQHHTNEEAIAHYRQTGEHLGIFDTPEHANAYAQSLHQRQDQYYHGGAAQQQKMTAGELIRGLRGIRQKYDIAAPGIEAGEKQLESEAAAREAEQGLERKIETTQRLGKKYGVETAPAIEALLGGYKPTAAATKWTTKPKPGTVDGNPVDWYTQTDPAGDIRVVDANGDEVSPDELARFQPAAGKGAGAAKPRHAWSKDKSGKFFSVLLDPNTNQPVKGSENYGEQPPASLTGRISTGQYHFVDSEGKVHEVSETRTSMPATGGGAGAGVPRAGGDRILGQKDTPESTAAKKIADQMETDASAANAYMQQRKAGQKSATADSSIVVSWVRAQVRGAGRMTNTEIEFGLSSGSFGTRFSNAYNRALEGTLDDTFVEQMIGDINRATKAARETADKYKPGATTSGTKGRRSLKAAMALPAMKGKTEDQVRQALKQYGYEVIEDTK